MWENNQRFFGMLQILGAAFLWGTAGTLAKYLFNNEIIPLDLAQVRITLSFIILFFLLLISQKKLLTIHLCDLKYFATFGILGIGLVQLSYLFTISLTNVATAVFLQYLSPAFVLIYGVIRGRESLSTVKITALIAALSGGYFIVYNTLLHCEINNLGIVSGLVSAMAYSFYTIYGKSVLDHYNSWTLLVWGLGCGSFVWLFYQSPLNLIHQYGVTVWLQFVYIVVVATILPFGLYLKGLKRLSAFNTGLICSTEPVIAAASAAIFLGEHLTFIQITGCLLILVGAILVQMQSEKKVIQKKSGCL